MSITPLSPTEAHAPAPRRGRLRRVVLATVAAGAITLSALTAQPASAYSTPGTGAYHVATISPMYVQSAGAYYPAYRQINAPAVSVRSTLARGSASWQTVVVDATLQRWNDRTQNWVTYDFLSTRKDILGGQSATLTPGTFGSWTRGYYYRALVTVKYTTHSTVFVGDRDPITGAAAGRVVSTLTGRVDFIPNTAADQQCAVVHCLSYAGYALVG